MENANLRERNIAIERGDLFTDRSSKGGGIRQARGRHNPNQVYLNFGGRGVQLQREILLQRKMSHVPNNADNLTHLRLFIANAPARLDPFANYILSREKFLNEALIHYNDRKRVKLVRFLENSALQERNAHC